MFEMANHPSADEVEVIVFGPGYGECVVVHIGQSNWIIIDSCLNDEKKPVARVYLDSIGVSPDQVKYIVVSHWHDDHTRGISELASYYSNARIGVSNVLNSKEGKIFATAYSGQITGLTRGTKELFTIFKECKPRIEPLSQHTLLMQPSEKLGTIQALSPTNACYLDALQLLHNAIPKPGMQQPINEALTFSPNNEAIAIHIDTGEFAILLGSDLESEQNGWITLIESLKGKKIKPADFYKVAHHGSPTAECKAVWDTLLCKSPVSVLTPFNHGNVSLPNESDRARINKNSLTAHISSQSSLRPVMDSRISRRLSLIGTAPVPLNRKLGAVRSRKSLANRDGSEGWSFSYFGAAGKM